MRSFDIDNFPETLQAISNLRTPEEQDNAIDIANKLWMASVLTDRPMCLSDEAIETYAGEFALEIRFSDTKKILQSLREEIFRSYDMVERFEYTRNNELDILNDFQDFLVDIGADEDPAESSIMGLIEFHEMETDSVDEIVDGVVASLQSEYLLLYGRVFTDTQEDYLRKTSYELYEGKDYNNFKNFIMEDTTMTANYKTTEREMNNHSDAMLMLETLLAGKEDNVTANEAVEEFKNNYFNMLAEDKAYASRKGRRKFAHEMLCELAKIEPRVATLINDEKAEMLIVERICNPIIDSVNAKASGDDILDAIRNASKSEETPKKPAIVRLTSKIFAFIKNIFKSIGKFFKMIAEEAGAAYEWILTHGITRAIFDVGTSLAAGCAIGYGVKMAAAAIAEKFGLVLIANGAVTVPGMLIAIGSFLVIGALSVVYSKVKMAIRGLILEHRGYVFNGFQWVKTEPANAN